MLDRRRSSLIVGAFHALLANAAFGQVVPTTVTLGILGDSNSDEYRAEDNRGGSFASNTFNWVEVLERLSDVDVGKWGTYSEPRRSGYEYNWARSGAKAEDLAAQQGGLAQQVREGKVAYVAIHIGTNDFHPESSYRDVYNGTVSGAALQRKIDGIIEDIRSAIQAVTDAGAKVVVTSVPDAGVHPGYWSTYPDAARRQRVTDAINEINAAIRADASTDPDVVYADLTTFSQALVARVDAQGNVVIGGERFSMLTRGDEPHHMQLGDASGHPGTVSSALMANGLIIESLNAFGTAIPAITDREMLCIAGIDTANNCSVVRPNPPVLTVH